jgi:mannose-6-phosphate isomerase-like protein (cupin superfamily)
MTCSSADEKEASCRVFRVYVDVPTHYHATCDEYLLVVAGRGLFKIGDGEWFEARVGQARSDGHHLREPGRRNT